MEIGRRSTCECAPAPACIPSRLGARTSRLYATSKPGRAANLVPRLAASADARQRGALCQHSISDLLLPIDGGMGGVPHSVEEPAIKRAYFMAGEEVTQISQSNV